MRDFRENRKKNLDLVLCVPNGGPAPRRPTTFGELVGRYSIILSPEEEAALAALPSLVQSPVGAVQVALEAKACMTEHIKARPRLYDELSSSHQMIHGASSTAIAVGFVMINVATEFFSPGKREISRHRQPDVAARVLEKVEELPRRASTGERGFDAMGAVMIECRNDGVTPVRLITTPPAPPAGDVFNYRQMVRRIASLYESRFPRL